MTLGVRVATGQLGGIKVPEGVVAVWGEDWKGNPVVRALRPGWEAALRGKMGEGFDIKGPHATLCDICGRVLFSSTCSGLTNVIQKHSLRKHDRSLPMLP